MNNNLSLTSLTIYIRTANSKPMSRHVEMQGFARVTPEQLEQEMALKYHASQEYFRSLQKVVNQSKQPVGFGSKTRFIKQDQGLDFQDPSELQDFIKSAMKSTSPEAGLGLLQQAYAWILNRLGMRLSGFTSDNLDSISGFLSSMVTLWKSGIVDLSSDSQANETSKGAVMNAAKKAQGVYQVQAINPKNAFQVKYKVPINRRPATITFAQGMKIARKGNYL